MAALMVSKMPASEAAALLERISGVKISEATLQRQARRQGERAQEKRSELDAQMKGSGGLWQRECEAGRAGTLVIELDAWNIRERDGWGQSEAMRSEGREPPRWHWVYGGTCFALSERVRGTGGRAMVLSRGYVMTRGGVDALREQLWAEASRHGLSTAARVLIIADGAVWIWNLASDRFPQASQRVDYYHVSEHLWAVARALHPEDAQAARAWVEPLLRKLKADQSCEVIGQLEQLITRLGQGAQRETLERETNYLRTHRNRLDYGTAKQRGEPLGSGAMESTCRQYQCRFKRTGQYWSQRGDESLMCLETFWRNKRWHLLFPHCLCPHSFKN
jgi:hypothetical protein